MEDNFLEALLPQVRACTICADHLPLGPRPVVQISKGAPIVIIGQAPGTKVHESGIPWQDASGDHLREWLAIDDEVFYDPAQIAVIPMGFCYPGRKDNADAPPRPECAPYWHDSLLAHTAENALVLLVGMHAQKHYLGRARKKTLTNTVRAFESYLPSYFPLPHPSWRSRAWIKRQPWFEADVLPVLRKAINDRLLSNLR